MFIFLECALRELRRRKKRTVALIFGNMITILTLVILLTVIALSSDASGKILTTTGTHFMFYSPIASAGQSANAALPTGCSTAEFQTYDVYNMREYDPVKEGFIADDLLTNVFDKSIIEDIRKIDYVKDASAYLLFRLNSQDGSHVFSVGGIDTTNILAVYTNTCAPNDVISGRFLESADSNVVMVESGYANVHSLSLDQTVNISGKDYKIIGIVNSGIRPGKADVYMPFQDAEAAINRRLVKPLSNNFNVVLIEVANAKFQPQVLAEVDKVTRGIISTYNCYVPAAQVLGINERFLSLFVALLGVALFVIVAKSQYSAVIERRREIGILKVIGWTNKDIAVEIMIESVITALIGGIIGSVISLVLIMFVPIGNFLSPGTTINFAYTWAVLLIGLALSLIVGVAAGVLPAISSAKQKPADSIRDI